MGAAFGKCDLIRRLPRPTLGASSSTNGCSTKRYKLLFALASCLAAAVALAAGGTVLPTRAVPAFALTILCIGLWASAAIPEHLTALCFFTLACLFQVAPPAAVFSGFTSPTVWLVFGGLVVGAAIRQTGLGERVAVRMLAYSGHRYGSVIVALVLVGLALSFVMPSSVGRALLLMPIAASLAERIGLGKGTSGHTGILLATAFGSHVPAFAILPSNVPNMVLAAAAEANHAMAFSYLQYLLLHFPVLGLLKAALLAALVLLLFPARATHAPAPVAALGPMTPAERKMLLLVAGCLAMWSTDFVHHVSPAWISMAAAIVCLWPGSGLSAPKTFAQEINYGALFFVAGIVGLGQVMAEAQLGVLLAGAARLERWLASASGFGAFAGLSLLATAVATVTTLPGVPAVMSPLAPSLSAATGLPLPAVLMTQVVGFSAMVLPYQSPPLVVAIQAGGLRGGDASRLCVALFVASTVLLLPIDYLWWRLLGWL